MSSYSAGRPWRTRSQSPPGNSIGPGETVLTRTPCAARACAGAEACWMTAAFIAAYEFGALGVAVSSPEMDETATTEPPPAAAKCGSAASIAVTRGTRSVARLVAHCCGPLAEPAVTLETRM